MALVAVVMAGYLARVIVESRWEKRVLLIFGPIVMWMILGSFMVLWMGQGVFPPNGHVIVKCLPETMILLVAFLVVIGYQQLPVLWFGLRRLVGK